MFHVGHAGGELGGVDLERDKLRRGQLVLVPLGTQVAIVIGNHEITSKPAPLGLLLILLVEQ